MVLLHGKLIVVGQLLININNQDIFLDILGDMTVGKTAICHVAGNDATAFPKTYNCVSRSDQI